MLKKHLKGAFFNDLNLFDQFDQLFSIRAE